MPAPPRRAPARAHPVLEVRSASTTTRGVGLWERLERLPPPAPAALAPAPAWPGGAPPRWPLPPTPEAAALGVDAAATGSVPELGRALARDAGDPYLLAKRIHDWIALHVRYDVGARSAGRTPPQEADQVLATRTALCGGYTRLFAALAAVAGLEARVVAGTARSLGQGGAAEPHAWIALRVGDRWSLIDPTWDAGAARPDGTFEPRYSTRYLFTPPELLAATHLPADPRWQLLEPPRSAEDFAAAPLLTPDFHAQGLILLAPRGPVEVAERFTVRLANRGDRHLVVRYRRAGEPVVDDPRQACVVSQEGAELRAECALPAPGDYRVGLYTSAQAVGEHQGVGELAVRRR